MKFLIKIALIIGLIMSLPLLAKSVATLTAMKGNVSIENSSGTSHATLGALLEEKDSVITADRSKAQLIFEDETVVTVGKNSNFSIKTYLYEAGHEPRAEFGLLKGAMSTITGKIGKIAPEKFVVKTKTATIGIRGTNFTVIVLEDASQRVYCTYGAISVMINSETSIVKQGFYANVSSSGEVSVKAFSANELVGMKRDNFGKNEALKGTVSQDGMEVQSTVLLDNTTENVTDIIIKNITDDMQDLIQTQDTQTDNHIILRGLSIDTYSLTGMDASVSLSFLPDGSSFDATNSYIEVLNKTNASTQGEYDNWKFFVSSTPSDFISRDEFSTTFSSVELSPINGSTSKNALLLSSSMSATMDLATDDMMSWGKWDATVEYTYDDYGSPMTTSDTYSGLWVSGEPTDASVVAALGGYVTYAGKYQALQINASVPSTQEGVANLNVDFDADQATLTIFGNANTGGSINGDYSYSGMAVSGNTISGGTVSLGTGSANGTFYGTDGKSVGGNFYIENATAGTSVKGVYQVTESLPQ